MSPQNKYVTYFGNAWEVQAPVLHWVPPHDTRYNYIVSLIHIVVMRVRRQSQRKVTT